MAVHLLMAAALAAGHCAVPAGSAVLARSHAAVVWTETSPYGDTTTYGCLRSHGRRVELGGVSGLDGTSVRPVRLAGNYAAFVRAGGSGRDGSWSTSVVRVDLAGRVGD